MPRTDYMQLAMNFAQGGSIDEVLKRIQRILNKGVKASKDELKFVKTLLGIEETRELVQLKGAELETRIRGRLEEVQAKGIAREGTIRAEGSERRATRRVESQLRIEEKRAAKGLETPSRVALPREVASTTDKMIKLAQSQLDLGKPLPPPGEIEPLLKALETGELNPTRKRTVELLRRLQIERTGAAVSDATAQVLAKTPGLAGGALDDVTAQITKLVGLKGTLSPRDIGQLSELAKVAPIVREAQLAAGMNEGMLSSFLGGGKASSKAGMAKTLMEVGKLGEAGSMAEMATKIAGKVPRNVGIAKGGIGALLALLLGKTIFGGKPKEENALPPATQMQLLQAMASMQQQGALAGSLVGSREAGAEKSRAQSDLLRLQALQLMGGGGGQYL